MGESGCGESTLARLALRLIEPTAGSVQFGGEDVLAAARGARLLGLRRRMQIVFQDPFSSLSPRRTVGQSLVEPLVVHRIASGAVARAQASALLEEVGLDPLALERYPHAFSSGQRQRIGIARALVLQPELLVADEPVSALDVSVQAQILTLLKQLQAQRGLGFLFVSHDLAVVRWFCSRVAVMYLGRVVEQGSAAEVFEHPRHPYTRMLCEASPIPDAARRSALPRVTGEIPSASAPPPGCHFHPRCPVATELCRREYPGWTDTAGRVLRATTRSNRGVRAPARERTVASVANRIQLVDDGGGYAVFRVYIFERSVRPVVGQQHVDRLGQVGLARIDAQTAGIDRLCRPDYHQVRPCCTDRLCCMDRRRSGWGRMMPGVLPISVLG